MNNNLIIYQTNDNLTQFDVRIEQDTVWLTQAMLSELFEVKEHTITYHIKEIFESEELDNSATTRIFRVVRKEGNRMVTRNLDFYNLDMIIAVGYRVNSKRATQFRIWATSVLKDYLLSGYVVNDRINRLENKVFEHDKQLELLVQQALPPKQGIFFDNQLFDAWLFASDLIRQAKSSIILIDNYVDDVTLQLFAKRYKKAKVHIYTNQVSKQLQIDLDKFNAQYPKIEISQFSKAHDRFLIIDQKELYHIGASLKDLGKRWFAFTKIEDEKWLNEIIEKIK